MMEISIGILIIGSLYWDKKPHRVRWRRERLDVSASRNVFAPIRYGRQSQTRGNSYTMVFSEALTRLEEGLGCAVAVPCVRSLHSVHALLEEAEYLWAAEGSSGSFTGRISARWGCVAMAFNPRRCIPPELIDGWSRRVAQEDGYGHLCRVENEKQIVTADGVLAIPWPRGRDGLHLDLDALLATATNPTIVDGRYPSAKEVANRWKQSPGSSYVKYFWKNRAYGIATFQDDEIVKYLDGGVTA